MKVRTSLICMIFAAALPPVASAQEILPFPPAPSGSTAGLTIQDSTYKKRVEPKRLAEGAPNILIILMDDVGPATPSTYGGEINTPTLDRVAKTGRFVQPLPLHRDVLADPRFAALRTQPHARRQRPDRGDRQ